MKERRYNRRHKIPLIAKVRFSSKAGQRIQRFKVLDISRNGICLWCQEALPPGTTMELKIADCDTGVITNPGAWELMNGDLVNIRARGTVVRNERASRGMNGYRVAVEFTQPVRIQGL